MLAIQHHPGSFSDRWVAYCESQGIPFKLVDCYSNDIIQNLEGCDAFLWHFNHAGSRDITFAKQLLCSLQAAGKKVFPDFNTMWHFDDKVGQKYLLEAIGAPLAPSYVFYSPEAAVKWVAEAEYPLVFKLRGGAGSANVRLIKTQKEACRVIRKAFGKGFRQFNAWRSLKERWRKYRLGRGKIFDVLKGFIRLFIPTKYSRTAGRDKGYVYFQEYIPNNDHDIRIVVIDEKAFAIKRMVRKGDFRASGSGNILYEKELFDEGVVRLAKSISKRLKFQCMAYDFIVKNKDPLIVEISYGFSPEGYDSCPGYWDENMTWHDGEFDPYGWMIESLRKQ